MKLDRSQPFGQTYGPDSATHTYMQNGVYFGPDGEHADVPYNRKHHPHLFKQPAAPTDPEPAAEDVTVTAPQDAPPADAAQPSLVEELEAHTDAEVYVMALKLRDRLDQSDDPDKFVPQPADKALSIEFIARHVA